MIFSDRPRNPVFIYYKDTYTLHSAPVLVLTPALDQSPLILAWRKYFMPIQATTTQTQAMMQVRMMRAG